MKRKYIIPNSNFVYMVLQKSLCDGDFDPTHTTPGSIGVVSGGNNNSLTGAPERIKLYF